MPNKVLKDLKTTLTNSLAGQASDGKPVCCTLKCFIIMMYFDVPTTITHAPEGRQPLHNRLVMADQSVV
jgi:hypothetical protein